MKVRRGLDELLACASETGVTILVGALHRTDAGCEDAVYQIDADVGIRHMGSKRLLARGEEPWFVPGGDMGPQEIRGLRGGFVVCREGSMVPELQGIGLEGGDLILRLCGGQLPARRRGPGGSLRRTGHPVGLRDLPSRDTAA